MIIIYTQSPKEGGVAIISRFEKGIAVAQPEEGV